MLAALIEGDHRYTDLSSEEFQVMLKPVEYTQEELYFESTAPLKPDSKDFYWKSVVYIYMNMTYIHAWNYDVLLYVQCCTNKKCMYSNQHISKVIGLYIRLEVMLYL